MGKTETKTTLHFGTFSYQVEIANSCCSTRMLSNLWSWLLTALSSSSTSSTNTSPLSTNTSTTRPLMIAVEGNIASGKSTFLELLSKQHHVAIFPEPVARWTDVGGTNLFRNMMEDGPRWMHAFQFYSSLTRVEIAYKAAKAPASISIMERSLFSERYCFVQMMAEAGSLTQGEFTILNRWFKMLTGRGDPSLALDLIVYIEAEPEVLMQRIRGRGRGGEETLAREYLDQVHARHQAWLDEGAFPLPAPVVRINGNGDLADFTKEVDKFASSLPALLEAKHSL